MLLRYLKSYICNSVAELRYKTLSTKSTRNSLPYMEDVVLARLFLSEKPLRTDSTSNSDILKDLEWCGFIRSYTMMGYRKKSDIFQLIDHYTLFYYEYIDGVRQGSNYWRSMLGTPKYNTWCGLAFERTCLWHVDQIKKKLGISGILTNEYAWRC